MANKLGHRLATLVEQNQRELELIEYGLLTLHLISSLRPQMQENNARLTDLGIRFCENIENYHFDQSDWPDTGESN